jgi:hypothetical protein
MRAEPKAEILAIPRFPFPFLPFFRTIKKYEFIRAKAWSLSAYGMNPCYLRQWTTAMVSKIVTTCAVSSAAFLINIPMGYWRVMVRKYSWQWFLAIHLAVPLIFLLRVKSGLGYGAIPALVVCAISGQLLGGKIENKPM